MRTITPEGLSRAERANLDFLAAKHGLPVERISLGRELGQAWAVVPGVAGITAL